MTDLKSNNEYDSLEAFFHERLKDASFAPAGESWQQIEAELELMEKKRRKRRFLWFFSSGLILLCGLASLWFFVLDEKFNAKPVAQKSVMNAAGENKITAAKETNTNDQNEVTPSAAAQNENVPAENKTAEINSQPAQEKNIAIAQNKVAEPVSSVAKMNAAGNNQKIQLAACSRKANPAMFNKLPYKVIEVESADGYIRYFADVTVSDEALGVIHAAGFSKAFVKKNYDADSDAVIVKNEGVIESNPSAYIAANTSRPASSHTLNKTNTSVIPAMAANKTNTVAPAGSVNNDTYTKHTDQSITEVIPSPNYNPEPPAATAGNAGKNGNSNSNTATGSQPVTANPTTGAADQNAASTGETKNDQVASAPSETKADSVPPLANNESKTDSVPKKSEPADSTGKPVAGVIPAPFTPEWALLLLAGPNIFTSEASSNLYATSGESQPVTVNTALKVQFKPFKKVSFSGGVNYTQFSTKQDITKFYFDKNQKSDYIFYSAFGSMAVPMSTMMEGFSPLVPFDTFTCKYSQTSKLNMLSIPLEMNFHFFERSRISLFAGLGANSSFALSQRGTLTLHKENFDNNVSYNSVTVNRFSMSLMLSLGCDVRIGKRMYLTFVPSYRYGLTNLSTTSGTTFAPAYFSGNAGLKFKL